MSLFEPYFHSHAHAVSLKVMLATLGGALGKYGHSPRDDYEAAPRVFDLEGFGKAFATFVFAQLAHHGVSALRCVCRAEVQQR